MGKIFEEFGSVIVTMLVILVVVNFLIAILSPGGAMARALEDMVNSFVASSNESAAANFGELGEIEIECAGNAAL